MMDKPDRGQVFVRVEIVPHDAAVNGEHYSAGTHTAIEQATELRRLADHVEAYWADSSECICKKS